MTMNKGNTHVLSIVEERAAQYGPGSCTDRRQRQLQTLARRHLRPRRFGSTTHSRRERSTALVPRAQLSTALKITDYQGITSRTHRNPISLNR